MIEFLKAELAPTPGRTVATARIVIAALFGATIAVGFHMPHGHWIMITVFTVSQSDAGSTLRKGIQRIVGTVAGGLLALLGIIAFADQPWFLVPFIGLGSALALFLSRTTSAPYVGLLAGLTFLILLPDVTDPSLAVDAALARIFVIALGTMIGTAAQLWLWPSDPEDLLLDDLTTRLGTIDAILARVLAGAQVSPGPLEPLAASGLARELDLLGNSEARHASLRSKHLLQAAVIIEVDRLLTASLWFERTARGVELDAPLRARLSAVRARSLEVRRVLAERRRQRRVASASEPSVERGSPAAESGVQQAEPRAPAGAPGTPVDSAGAAARVLGPALIELELAVGALAAAALLAPAENDHPERWSWLDISESQGFLTPAFSTSNTIALQYAIKGGLGATICYLLYNGLAWPAISTCVVTTLIVAQSSLGAGVQKAVLRIAGTLVGALVGVLTIVVAMPNLESLPALLTVLSVGYAIAAWLTVGSSRIAYAGIQTAMALAMYTVDVFGPTTNLAPGRDRVVGILIGIIVMSVIDRTIWPVFASRGIRPHLAAALRAMAEVSRVGLRPGDTVERARSGSAGLRLTIYQELTEVLRLRDELRLEPGAHEAGPQAESAMLMRFAGRSQQLFLGLFAIVRHRLDVKLEEAPAALLERMRTLAAAIGEALELAAGRIEGSLVGSVLDVQKELTRAAEAAAAEAASLRAAVPGGRLGTNIEARLELYRELVPAVAQLVDDADRAAEQAAPMPRISIGSMSTQTPAT